LPSALVDWNNNYGNDPTNGLNGLQFPTPILPRVFLKCLDLKTHRRLREVELFRCLAEAELFRNCPKNDQTETVQACH
jgi:hypothetical protein